MEISNVKVDINKLKELRERTGAGVMECREALIRADGDIDRAIEILRERGVQIAEKKAARVASQGLIDAYIHAGGRIGAMVEVNCETDFVARLDEFKTLVREVAMQVAAMGPKYVSAEELPPDSDEAPEEVCLLEQPYIRDPSRKVKDLVTELIAKTGENIKIRRFCRYELGGI